jgi:hypothetical protein
MKFGHNVKSIFGFSKSEAGVKEDGISSESNGTVSIGKASSLNGSVLIRTIASEIKSNEDS